MVSKKQIQANRRNALKSTGPKTPEGKALARLMLQNTVFSRKRSFFREKTKTP